jgi:predicted regulator of Ras-like GTPase activity (Roadblock/LC7/MglB family)
VVSDDRSQDSWDALFGVGAAASPPGAKGPQTPAGKLGKYLEMPGVRGVVRVALDGLVLDQAGEVDSEQHGALTAFIGASGGQLGQILRLGPLHYAVLSFTDEPRPFLIVRHHEGYLGLLLEPEISPTHIIARLQPAQGEA